MSKILLRGPCDVTAIKTYLYESEDIEIQSAFRGARLATVWDVAISTYLMQAALNRRINSRFIEQSFYPNEDIFSSKYAGIIISVIGDGMLGFYENKKDLSHLAYGLFPCDATKNDGIEYFSPNIQHGGLPDITKEEYRQFSQEYRFLGRISPLESATNYKIFIDALFPNTRVIILLGPTVLNKYGEQSTPMKNGGKEFYSQLNKELIKTFNNYQNVFLIDPKDHYVETKNEYEMFYYGFPSLAHYPCLTYYKMAQEISKIFPEVQVDEQKFIEQQNNRKQKFKY